MATALASLRLSLRDRAASLGLTSFLHWWLAQLAPLVPTLPRNAVHRRRLRPVLAFEEGTAVLWEVRAIDGNIVHAPATRIALTGDSAAIAHAGRTAIEGLPQRVYGGLTSSARVVLALPRQQVLRRQLTLPAAVEENLRGALAYDLDRLTPFRPDQLYFDAVVVGRDIPRREIRVDWAAALRTNVDQARQQAESWGATVAAVTPEMFDSSTDTPRAIRWSKLNLLPEEDRPDRPFWRRWQFLVPLGVLALIALIVVILPVWQKRDYVISLAQTTEQARVQAAAADVLRQQLDQAVGDYNFALERKYGYPTMVQLLEDVSKLLPDDTWLTQLEVKTAARGKESRREIVLRGESGNAGNLVSKLEESRLFEQAAPRSPTTKIQPGPGEVFDLGAQLRLLPMPQSVRLARAAPPAPPVAATAPGTAAPGAAASAGAPASAAAGAPPAATGGGQAPATAGAATPPQGTPAAASAAAPQGGNAATAMPAAGGGTAAAGAAAPAGQGGGRPILQRVSPAAQPGAAPPAPTAEAGEAPTEGEAPPDDASASAPPADQNGAAQPAEAGTEADAGAATAAPQTQPQPRQRRASSRNRRGQPQ